MDIEQPRDSGLVDDVAVHETRELAAEAWQMGGSSSSSAVRSPPRQNDSSRATVSGSNLDTQFSWQLYTWPKAAKKT